MLDKKKLSLILSKLKTFDKPQVEYEQYQTPSELAATALWKAYMDGNIAKKAIVDLGCGTGIFGIGCLVLGAKKVTFVDVDERALKIAKENKAFVESMLKSKLNASFLKKEIKEYSGKADVAVQNPPFGVKKPHIDKLFLEVAMRTAPIIYSFHKIESKNFIEKFADDNGYCIESITSIRFPLKAIFRFHKEKNYFVETGLWKLVKKGHRKF